MELTYEQAKIPIMVFVLLLLYLMINGVILLFQGLKAPEERKPKLFGTGRQQVEFWLILCFGMIMSTFGLLPSFKIVAANEEDTV